MKEGWKILEFEKCLQKVAKSKKIPKKNFLEEGLFPIISQEREYINGYWDEPEDVLKVAKPIVVFGDHTKIVKFIDFDFVIGADGVKTLLPIEQLNSKFFAYQLNNIELRDLGYARHYRLLKETNIVIPPLTEQKQIVAILDKAFETIDQAKANIEKNIENAKELFQSKLNEIFNQKGDGWEDKSLGDESLLKIVDGDRGKNYPKKKDFLQEGHCVFMNTGNVRHNGLDFSNVMFISKERDSLLRKGKLERDDVVMTTRGTIGNLGWYNSNIQFDHVRINSGMLILRVNKEKILPEYLFTLLRSSIVTRQIAEKTSGAAQPQLPIKTLITFKIPVSSNLNEQKEMVNLIERMEKQQRKLIGLYSEKISNILELKKSILQKAFAGELTE